MSLWRIVNPALNPPQVAFESGDEQAALREFVASDARVRGLLLTKSEDVGTSWVEVEARAPDAVESASPSRHTVSFSAEKSDAETEHAETRSLPKHRK